jgi:DNA-binding response OmpR family regulator
MSSRKRKVVVADDEYVISRCVAFMLKKEGFECRTASDGETALALLREDPPDVLILDLDMPKKNGFEVCAAVRADPALKDIHVLVLTAKGQPMQRDWRSRIEADSFMLKPFDPRALLRHVQQMAGGEEAPVAEVEEEPDPATPRR